MAETSWLFILGAQKAGTTFLFSTLTQNPYVRYGMFKEMNYFNRDWSDDELGRSYVERWRARVHDRVEKQGPKYGRYADQQLGRSVGFDLDWYKDFFLKKPVNRRHHRQNGKIAFCDSSVAYAGMDRDKVENLKKCFPDASPIIIVRDPVARMISGMSMYIEKRTGDYDFEALKQTQLANGNYSEFLPLYKSQYQNLRIVPFRQVAKGLPGLLTAIEGDLDIPSHDYSFEKSRRNSRTGKVEVPQELQDFATEACAPQYEFLKQEFGTEFLNEI